MSPYTLISVTNKYLEDKFIRLPYELYRGVSNYIQPMDADIKKVFDSQKNNFFKHGECSRWILEDNNGKVIGRIAAFIDNNTVSVYEQPTGGIGFFECINDQSAAFKLFNTCKEWLEQRGIEAMDGPINFGKRLQWWGLHVNGDYRPLYGMFYHHHYYKRFFEEYGFKCFFKQFTYRMVLKKESLNKIVLLKAKRVYRDKKFRAEFFDKTKTEKYIRDFATIYNRTWISDIPGVSEIALDEVRETFTLIKPILKEKYIIFAYYGEQPIGFFVMVPNANEFLRYANGKFNFSAKLRFLWYKYFQKDKTVIGQVFGVDKDFQKRGVESILIEKFSQVIFPGKEKFKYLEFNWIGDFNIHMRHLLEEYLSAKILKTHITYRYLFDRNKPFKRAGNSG